MLLAPRLLRCERRLRPRRDHLALFLIHSGVYVQHERIDVQRELHTLVVHADAIGDRDRRELARRAASAMENARLLSELRQRTDEVAELNRGLEARVAEQVDELGRVGRLKRFLAPQLAELIVSHGDEKILESHRREIVVVFAICAATPPSPRRRSPRKCWISYASITAR